MYKFVGMWICLALLLYSPKIIACECESFNESISSAIKRSSAIFAGKILKIEAYEDKEESFTFKDYLVTFRVTKSWKKIQEKEVKIYTTPVGTSCGYPFNPNEEYLVYTYDGTYYPLETSICTRTRRFKDAQQDLKKLGKPIFVVSVSD
jgi:hypothetical protein